MSVRGKHRVPIVGRWSRWYVAAIGRLIDRLAELLDGGQANPDPKPRTADDAWADFERAVRKHKRRGGR